MLRVVLGLCALIALSGCLAPRGAGNPPPIAPSDVDFTQDGTVQAVEEWLGVSAATAADIVEGVFSDLGRPVGHIYGEEASGAITAGLRYGQGWLVLDNGYRTPIYWQGPTIGWDLGANTSKVFTLVYDLPEPGAIYRRYPGVEGSAYLVGGVGVNYQYADPTTLVPMRAGVGARLGANIGYLAYTPLPRALPF